MIKPCLRVTSVIGLIFYDGGDVTRVVLLQLRLTNRPDMIFDKHIFSVKFCLMRMITIVTDDDNGYYYYYRVPLICPEPFLAFSGSVGPSPIDCRQVYRAGEYTPLEGGECGRLALEEEPRQQQEAVQLHLPRQSQHQAGTDRQGASNNQSINQILNEWINQANNYQSINQKSINQFLGLGARERGKERPAAWVDLRGRVLLGAGDRCRHYAREQGRRGNLQWGVGRRPFRRLTAARRAL